MPYLRDRVIILRSEPFREHDVRVSGYGYKTGKLMAVARGARLPQAKHLGHLEPLSEVEMMLAKGAAFDKVAVARLVNPRPYLRQSLSAVCLAGAVAGLVDTLTYPGAPEAEVYTLLRDACAVCADLKTDLTPARSQFLYSVCALKLLRSLGHVPDMHHDPSRHVLLHDTHLPEHAAPLLAFALERSLGDCLRVTAPTQLLEVTQTVVLACLEPMHVDTLPHGFTSLRCILSGLEDSSTPHQVRGRLSP